MQVSNTSEVEGEEEDITWLTLRKPNVDTHARLQPPIDLTSLPGHLSLFEASSQHNLVMAGGADGFNVYLLSDLENLLGNSPKSTTVLAKPFKTVTIGQRLVWLRLAKEETVLVVGTASSQILLYSLLDIRSESTPSPQPTQTFPALPSPINSLLPNPSAFPSLLIVLLPGCLSLLDIDTQKESARLEGAYTAACWSAKGKQFVLGDAQARLRFFSPDGQEKGAPIERPAGLAESEGYYVHSVNWLENDVFLVVYNLPSVDSTAEPEHSYETFIIQRIKLPSPEIKYTRFSDPTPAYGMIDRPGMRYSSFLPGWGGKGNWLGFLGTSPSPQLGVIQGTSTGEWKILNLDEATRPGVPMTEDTAEDTAILGMALDLRSDKKIKRGMEGGEELKDLEPAPKLMIFTSDGVLASWDLWNVDEQMGSYEGMINSSAPVAAAKALGRVAGEISMAGTPAGSPPSTAGAASPFAGFGLGSSSTPSAFGTSAFSGSSPAPVKPVSSGSAFGASAFGSSSSPSPFGAPSAFGSSSFGQTSAFGSGAKPPVPAFGSSSSSTTNPPSIFGSTEGTSSTGSSNQTKDSQPTGFGAFGQSTPSAFGTSTAPSVFGSTAAPAPPAPSIFGQRSGSGETSAFGSSSASVPSSTSNTPEPLSGFGAFSVSSGKPSGFGVASSSSSTPTTTATTNEPSTSFKFGSTGSAFGQTSASGAGLSSPFGSASKPKEENKKETATEERKPASPFSGGFGAFSNVNPTPSPSTTTPSVTAPVSSSPVVSAFGQPSKPAFGVSTFGAPATFGSSAFGTPSTSKFGSSAFGSSTSPSTATSPASGAGFGSFSSSKAGVGFVGFGSSANKPPVFGNPSTSAFDKPTASDSTSSKFGSSPSSSSGGFAGFGAKNPASSGSSSVTSAFGGAFARAGTGSSFGRSQDQGEDDEDGGARVDEISDEDEDEEVVAVKNTTRADRSDNLFGSTAFSFGGLGGQGSEKGKENSTGMFGGLSVDDDDNGEVDEDKLDDDEDEGEDEDEEEVGEDGEDEDEEDDDDDDDDDVEEEEQQTERIAPEQEEKKDVVKVEVEDKDQVEESVAEIVETKSPKIFIPITPESTTPPASPPVLDEPQVTATVVKIEEISTDQEDAGAEGSASTPETDASPPVEEKAASTVTFEPSEEPEIQPKNTEEVLSTSPPPSQKDSPSLEQSSPSASSSPVVASTPSAPSFGKPSAFGSKPAFPTGKGFLSSAPIKSSPLASPPISLNSSSTTPPDSPVKPPSMIPVPANSKSEQSSSASPFSFGAKPLDTAAPKPAAPFGFSASEPSAIVKQPEFGKAIGTTENSAFVKPAASPFAGFGQSQLPVPTKDEAKPSGSTSMFSGFGATSDSSSTNKFAGFAPTPVPPTETSTALTTSSGGFSFNAKPAEGTVQNKPSAFGSFGSSQPTSSQPSFSFAGSEAPKPGTSTGGFGAFGFPKPSSAPNNVPAATPAFGGFGATNSASTSGSPFNPGLKSNPTGVEASNPFSAPVLKTSETPKDVSPVAFNNSLTTSKPEAVKPAFPQRSSAPTPKVSDLNLSRETGLAGEFVRAYQSMEADFEKMRATSQAYSTFQREAGTPTPVAGDLQTQKTWTLGDLKSFNKLIKEKEKDTSSLKNESEEMKRTIGELQSYLLKADTKLEEVARFLRARDDPDFAKMVRIRQLGPEHLENQQRLRKTTQTVRDRIGQLETHLDILRKEVIREKSGRASMKAPTLDSISRTIRNITAAVREKAFEIDSLSLRLDVLQLSDSNKNAPFRALNSPDQSRREPTPLSESVSLTASPLRAIAAKPTPKVGAIAARVLSSESKALQLKKRLVTINKGPVITLAPERMGGSAPSTGNSSVVPDGFVVRSPVKFEALPSPRRATPTIQTSVVGTTSREVSSETHLKEAPVASPSFSSFSPDTTFQSSSSFLETPSKPPRPMFALSSTPTGTPPVAAAGSNNGLGLVSSFSALPSNQAIGTFASADFQPLQPGREYEPKRRTGRMSTHQSAPKLGAHAGSAKPASPSGFSFGPPPVLLNTAGSFSNTFEGLQPPKPASTAASGRFGFANMSQASSLPKSQPAGQGYEEEDEDEEEDETDEENDDGEEGEEEDQEDEEEEDEEDDEDYWAREGEGEESG